LGFVSAGPAARSRLRGHAALGFIPLDGLRRFLSSFIFHLLSFIFHLLSLIFVGARYAGGCGHADELPRCRNLQWAAILLLIF